ncbi:hypothetical protein PIB30_076983 [Stylosanthes scabra]|uniref:Uncharacterized protein n=1 Tax=Stylosanthes scabra TaxID=79078 RepID=A0ABU6ZNZ9_9FABA|nr:hypothetical protein [Stylosanthes scabra]
MLQSSTQRAPSSLSTKGTSSSCHRVASKTLRMLRSWELIPPSECWMYEGDEEENKNEGMEPSVENKEASEEHSKEEEDPEEEVPTSSSLSMVIDDATEDYLHFIKELERSPAYSPIRSGHALVPDSPENASNRQSDVLYPSLGDHCKVRPGVHGFSLLFLLPTSVVGQATSKSLSSAARSCLFCLLIVLLLRHGRGSPNCCFCLLVVDPASWLKILCDFCSSILFAVGRKLSFGHGKHI